MTRWRCARWCCQPFVQPTTHQPYHLCAKTGRVDAYVADTSPQQPALVAVPTLPTLRAVA